MWRFFFTYLTGTRTVCKQSRAASRVEMERHIYINKHEMMNIASVEAECQQVDRYCTKSRFLKAGSPCHQAESQARSMLLLLLLYYASTAVPGYR